MPVTSKKVSEAADQAGLGSLQVMVHSSLRSFGWVLGGARSVIDGLLDQECTVMVPTMTTPLYQITPPCDERPSRNGIDYGNYLLGQSETKKIYSPESNLINKSMGAIPKAVLGMKNRYRGNHPCQSFTAVGPRAAELVAAQSPLDVYNPIRKLSRSGGMIVLMGVGLTRITALHLAEEMAGRNLFRRWAQGRNGPVQVAIGGCSEGFHKLDVALSPIEQKVVVGNSLWRIFPVSDLLNRASKAIQRDPMVTHCGKKSCRHCDDAVAGGPLITTK